MRLTGHNGPVTHVDLVLIGSGSGNSIIDERFAGKQVALIDDGDPFGGTCLNKGCLPTKMYVHVADLAADIRDAPRLGLSAGEPRVSWRAVRDRIFGRTDGIAAAGEQHRADQENVMLLRGRARFTGERALRVECSDGASVDLTADAVVIATGSHPSVPDIDGVDDPAVAPRLHTSDTIMRVDELPRSLVILGGGVVAAECAHIFSALGTRVTLVNRSDWLLRNEDTEIAEAFTNLLGRTIDVRLAETPTSIRAAGDDALEVRTRSSSGAEHTYQAELVLLATGRTPSLDLALDLAGVQLTDAGYIAVDRFQRTTAEGVFALGDVSNPQQLKHAANQDARVVRHNLLHPDDMVESHHEPMPQAIFSNPQVASVGSTEQALLAAGTAYDKGVARYSGIGFGWALEDTDHFMKVLVDPRSGHILGGHIMGPQASTLIQPLVQAMAFGTPARELARGMYWIHPALTELVENALLDAAPDPR